MVKSGITAEAVKGGENGKSGNVAKWRTVNTARKWYLRAEYIRRREWYTGGNDNMAKLYEMVIIETWPKMAKL